MNNHLSSEVAQELNPVALKLTRIRSMLYDAVQEAELLLGINEAFPATIRIAAIIDDLDKQISTASVRGDQ